MRQIILNGKDFESILEAIFETMDAPAVNPTPKPAKPVKNEQTNCRKCPLNNKNHQNNKPNNTAAKFSIRHIKYNGPATIVFWDDNTKTVAVCDENDNYNKETGVYVCILKKLLGNKEFAMLCNSIF